MTRTLRQRVEWAGGEPFSDLEATAIVLQAARILATAHAEGCAHGGLTPDDIVLVDREGPPEVRVEGIRGASDDAASVSDIGALTGLLFTCLTGELPPYARRGVERGDPSRLDDPRWHWDHVQEIRAGLERPAWTGRPASEGFESIDAVVAALRPTLAEELERAGEIDADTERAIAFAAEVTAQRERRERHAERLRCLDEWFEANADPVARCDEIQDRWSALQATLGALEADFVAPPAAARTADDPRHVRRTESQPWILAEALTTPLPAEATELLERPVRVPTPTIAALVLATAGLVGWYARPGVPTERSMVPRAHAAPNQPVATPPAAPEAPAEAAALDMPAPAETPTAFDDPFLDDAGVSPPAAAPTPEPAAPEPPAPEPPAPKPAEAGASLDGDMLMVPGGSVTVGRTEVAVSAFYIDRVEVSQAAYLKCVSAGKCRLFTRRWDDERHPATGVTRDMAAAFCAHRGARLPTAAEWSRAAGSARYPWGDVYEPGRMNRSTGDRYRYVAPVDAFTDAGASPFGVLGMAGNVREWTASARGGKAVVAGTGFADGAWKRTTRTRAIDPQTAKRDLGFRCAE